nr:unnamed protein product [Callosobruchus analis]
MIWDVSINIYIEYLVKTESFKQDKFVLVLRISFICSWQNKRQSFNNGSICKKAADTRIAVPK